MYLFLEFRRRRIYVIGRQKKGNDRVKLEGNELEKKKKIRKIYLIV